MNFTIEKGIFRILIVLSILLIVPAFNWVDSAWRDIDISFVVGFSSLILAYLFLVSLLWLGYFAIKWIIAGFQNK